MAKKNTDTVAVVEPDYKVITDFNEMVAAVTEQYGGIIDAAETLGDGFGLLEDKSKLVGVPFLIVDTATRTGDQGEFTTVRLMTSSHHKIIINDGGTGIHAQILELTEKTGRTGGFTVMRGLRRSDYVNEHGAGTTYYLNLSKPIDQIL